MKRDGSKTAALHFVRTVFLVDFILTSLVAVICFLLDLRTWRAFGTVLVWAGMAMIVLACITGIGGFAARVEDASAFSRSGAGDKFENFQRIGDARSSNLGCFVQLLFDGIGLIALGYLMQIIPILF